VIQPLISLGLAVIAAVPIFVVSSVALSDESANRNESRAGVPRLASYEQSLVSYNHRLDEVEAELAQLRNGYRDSYDCGNSEADACGECQCECNGCCPGWFASTDYLNWHVERDDLGYAIRDPGGIGVPLAGEPVLSLNLGPESGYRVAVGRRTTQGWELSTTYTHLHTDDRRSFAPGGAEVLAVQSSPPTGLTNADSVVATSDFQYDVLDFAVSHWFDVTDSASIMVLGGARFAWIDHLLEADYNGGAFVNGAIDVPTDIDAYGGRLGSALHWHMSSSLTLFGSTSLSVLASDVNARRQELNAGFVVLDAHQTTRPVLTAADVAIGVNYNRGNWSFGTGYELVSWFDAVRPLEFSDIFNGGTLARNATDLGLHGMFVNAAYVY